MGKLTEKDSVYIGNFVENKKHGYGELSVKEQLTQGFWVDDEYVGEESPFDEECSEEEKQSETGLQDP